MPRHQGSVRKGTYQIRSHITTQLELTKRRDPRYCRRPAPLEFMPQQGLLYVTLFINAATSKTEPG